LQDSFTAAVTNKIKLLPMPIKKSAAFSLLLATASVGTLVFTSYNSAGSPAEVKQQELVPVKCSQQYNNTNTPLPWNIVSGNLFHLEV